MAQFARQAANFWVDDHLDLYNFAVQIGDAEWQREILRTLQAKDSLIRELADHLVLQELWLRFDAINRKMLEIYDQLKQNRNSSNERQLREKVWELKQQRVMIANEIRTHCA